MNNIFGALKQAQELKNRISNLKDSLEKTHFNSKDSSGKVEVIISGKGELLDISIS